MKKAKKIIITLLIIIVVLVALIFAAYEIGMKFAADKAMDMMISNQINSMLDTGEITMDEVLEIAKLEPEDEVPEVIESEEAEAPGNEEASPQEGTLPKSQTQPAPKKQEAVKKATEKINEDIAARDKREVMELIRSHLSSEDMKYLLSLLSGGVTGEELNLAAKLAYSRFNGEEIVRVKEFWHKYKSGIKRAEK